MKILIKVVFYLEILFIRIICQEKKNYMKFDIIKIGKKIMMLSIKCNYVFKSYFCNCILYMLEKINDEFMKKIV